MFSVVNILQCGKHAGLILSSLDSGSSGLGVRSGLGLVHISISRHTQTQYDVDNWRLLLEIFLIKVANYLHLTASAYVGLSLCLCQSVNQPLGLCVLFLKGHCHGI